MAEKEWRLVRGGGSAEAAALLARALPLLRAVVRGEALPADVEVLRKKGGRRALRAPGLGVLKVFVPQGARASLAATLAPSRMAREFDTTLAAARCGIRVPRPLFLAERRVLGVLRGAAVLYEWLEGARTLAEVLRQNVARPGRRRERADDLRRLLRNVGALMGRLQRAGGLHGDPNARNVMVRPDSPDELYLLDWLDGLFLGERYGSWALGERIALARPAHHYKLSVGEVRAAQAAWRRGEGILPAYAAVQRRGLVKLVLWLVRCGAPFRALLDGARAWWAEVHGAPDSWRAALDELAEPCLESVRRHIGEAAEKATRETRTIAVRREGQAVWYARRGYDLRAVRAAAEALPEGGCTEEFEVRRGVPDVLGVWRVGCAAAVAVLPARLHVACRHAGGAGDALVLESARVPLERPHLTGADSTRRLAAFVRLVHALGFRFRRCGDATVRQQPRELGRLGFREGSGYVVDDAGALAFEPGSPLEASTQQVAAWVGGTWGAAQAEELRASCRPLRFSL